MNAYKSHLVTLQKVDYWAPPLETDSVELGRDRSLLCTQGRESTGRGKLESLVVLRKNSLIGGDFGRRRSGAGVGGERVSNTGKESLPKRTLDA